MIKWVQKKGCPHSQMAPSMEYLPTWLKLMVNVGSHIGYMEHLWFCKAHMTSIYEQLVWGVETEAKSTPKKASSEFLVKHEKQIRGCVFIRFSFQFSGSSQKGHWIESYHGFNDFLVIFTSTTLGELIPNLTCAYVSFMSASSINYIQM